MVSTCMRKGGKKLFPRHPVLTLLDTPIHVPGHHTHGADRSKAIHANALFASLISLSLSLSRSVSLCLCLCLSLYLSLSLCLSQSLFLSLSLSLSLPLQKLCFPKYYSSWSSIEPDWCQSCAFSNKFTQRLSKRHLSPLPPPTPNSYRDQQFQPQSLKWKLEQSERTLSTYLQK